MSQYKARPVGILTPIGLILCLTVWCSPRLSAAPVVMVEKSESAVIAPFVPPPPAKPSLVAVILSKLNPTSPTAALGEQKLTEQRLFVLKSGESLQSILAKANIESRDIDKAISSLNRTYDLRNLPVGTPIAVETIADQPTERQPREAGKGPAAPLPRQNLIAISFTPNIKNEILVTRETWLPPATVGQNPLQGGPVPEVKFVTSTKPRSLSHHLSSVTLTIQTSLYEAGERKAVPTKVMAQAIHLLSWDVDFQRDIQSGNQLRIIYDDYRPNGSSKGSVQMRPIGGEVYGLELTLSNRKVKIYRYQAQNGKILYLDEKGQGLAKALMRTPINGGRLTSRFGMRKNPVLGYTAMHKGIDFGAAPNTPILAAGDGTVTTRKYSESYGNTLEIRHKNGYSTLYAHMASFSETLRVGSRVTQGQVIGFVGQTGHATGPHLHYEVKIRGKSLNPMNLQMQKGSRIANAEMKQFAASRSLISSTTGTVDFATLPAEWSGPQQVATRK